MDILNFKEVLERTENIARSVLLGNGFSRAWNNKVFSYENLKEEVRFKDFSEQKSRLIKKLFDDLGTFDFEKVMHAMEISIHISRSRAPEGWYPVFEASIFSDIDVLKKSMADVIASVHPERPCEVTDAQYICVRKFLSNFSNIYTTNYDLLLYWARNKNSLEPSGFSTDDGFRQGAEWVGDDVDQDVFFLHGALHLYFDGVSVFKRVYDEGLGTLREQIMRGLKNNEFPLLVAEPNAKKKLQSIKSNPYLNFCFRKLKSMNGSLIIYGHSINETDAHIFEMINKSHIRDVYVSIFGDLDSDDSRRVVAESQKYFHKCNVMFFEAKSAHVWR
ncbi:DUF4917 family protein [Thalassolituus pacificus]|uniref:DUF4917 family protein n=1 Tax=Thalassolituus pacificus TaxID=2975440 RepID=A0A9X2WID1_9GAMM|nr:DUF4917 family protein [Thalassolituus pacificus]MCT7361044.1 DUF4917 family protein [Thalassolituus pacificus]